MKKLLMLSVICVALLTSCREKCESERIGSIQLDPIAYNVLKWKGTEKLIFKDKNGVERTFSGQGKKNQTIEIMAGVKCTTKKFESSFTGIYFYEEDAFFFNYVDAKQPNEFLHYDVTTVSDNNLEKDTVFLDVLNMDIRDSSNYKKVGYEAEGPVNSAWNGVQIVSSKRGYKGKYKQYNIDNTAFTLASIVINGKTLKNVIRLESTFYTVKSNIMYVSPSEGILAFTNNKDESWVLDRVE
jgi:hypothetical protein